MAQGKRIYLGVYLFINLDSVTWRLNAEYRGDPAFLAKAWSESEKGMGSNIGKGSEGSEARRKTSILRLRHEVSHFFF